MGTLRKVKMKMKMDGELRKMLVRGSRDEILIDLDGDKQADVALTDANNDGDLDTIALDLTGDGEFDLYFVDTDRNGIPDAVLFDEEGDGHLTVLDIGKNVEATLIEAAQDVCELILAEEYAAQRVDEALLDLERRVHEARKSLKKRGL